MFRQAQKFVFGAPFGACGTFLIKLSKIIQVVDIVSVALISLSELDSWRCAQVVYLCRRSLASWWQPDVADSNLLQTVQLPLQPLVVFTISRAIPLEALEQGVVLGHCDYEYG